MIIKGQITNIQGSSPNSILKIDNLNIQKLLPIEKYNYKAIVCERSTYFSHAEIFLENISIPTVFLQHDDFIKIPVGGVIEIDFLLKKLFLGNTVFGFSTALNISRHNSIDSTKNIIETKDGKIIKLELGLRNPHNLDIIQKSSINSVSIIHTETINFQNANFSEQLSRYTEICERLSDRQMSFRLFDFGEDKLFNWVPLSQNDISSFGLRGYRLYHKKEIRELIKNQISCFDLLSNDYDINVVVPYISSFNDFKNAQHLVNEFSNNRNLKLIPMLETVSAFFETNEISQKSHKMIIGTNDLLQSFFSANRNLPVNSNFLNPYSTGFIRFLNYIYQQNSLFTICGNLTLLDYYLSILIGIGYRSFIVPAQFYDSIADKILQINADTSKTIVDEIIKSDNYNIIEVLKNAAPNILYK